MDLSDSVIVGQLLIFDDAFLRSEQACNVGSPVALGMYRRICLVVVESS